jgi:hypothetical protein
MMGRKHYEAIAQALRISADVPTAITKSANVCALDNPRFDRRKFYEACGLEDKTNNVTVNAGAAEGSGGVD